MARAEGHVARGWETRGSIGLLGCVLIVACRERSPVEEYLHVTALEISESATPILPARGDDAHLADVIEIHIHDGDSDALLGCARLPEINAVGARYATRRPFLMPLPRRRYLRLADVRGRALYVWVVSRGERTCPQPFYGRRDRLVGRTAPFPAERLGHAWARQFEHVALSWRRSSARRRDHDLMISAHKNPYLRRIAPIGLAACAACVANGEPAPPAIIAAPGGPALIRVTEIEVIEKDFHRLEIEVHIDDAVTGEPLGCAGLEHVDRSHIFYPLLVDLVTPRGEPLTYASVRERDVIVRVLEDDEARCPGPATSADDVVGVSEPMAGAALSPALTLSMPNVPRLVIGTARSRLPDAR